MPKHVSAVDARKRLGALLDTVLRTGAEYVIERAGKPAAVIIPIQVYEKLTKDRDDAFTRVEALRKRLSQNATGKDLEEAIDESSESVRKRRQ